MCEEYLGGLNIPKKGFDLTCGINLIRLLQRRGQISARTDHLLLYSSFLFIFFKIFFFCCGPFLKFLLNLSQYCFCFMFWFFGHEACGILTPQPGIEPAPPALEGKVLTTGPPGKSPFLFKNDVLIQSCRYSCNNIFPQGNNKYSQVKNINFNSLIHCEQQQTPCDKMHVI